MKTAFFVLLFLCLTGNAALAEKPVEVTTPVEAPAPATKPGSVTGLPMPRFASIKDKEVNVRTGPGKRYPIDWVIVRQFMPVEIIGEHDVWRRIRDWEGTEGWVHQSMLSGRRTVLIVKDGFTLRKTKAFDAPPVAKVEPMVAAELEQCEQGWCKIKAAGFSGWVHSEYVWGVREEEAF